MGSCQTPRGHLLAGKGEPGGMGEGRDEGGRDRRDSEEARVVGVPRSGEGGGNDFAAFRAMLKFRIHSGDGRGVGPWRPERVVV